MYSLAACQGGPNPETPPADNPNLPVADNLARADELFKERPDVEKLRQARKLVATVRQPDHRNFEVEWKFAKFSLFLGDALTDDDEKEKVFEEGRDAGKYASRLQPDKPDGFFWYGANLAELAKLSPVTVGYMSVNDIRDAMNTVIKLQPDYQGASAYDVLAEIELNTRMFGGKATKAIEYLQKAIEIKKDNSNLRLHLAEAYLDDDKLALAKQQLEYIVKMQPDPDYLPEHRQNVVEAKKLLASRF
ncbi:MAG TPA: tetratricopeptide repeat protein [Pyrinomonadaceae bacterium]